MMSPRKTNAELQREVDQAEFIKAATPLFAEHRVQDIVYGAVKVILTALLMALIGLVWYASKTK